MTERRVVITGMGVICPIGTTVDEFWQNLLAERSNIDTIPQHWCYYTDFCSKLWSPLPAVDFATRGITRAQLIQNDPVTLMSLCAAKEAVENAGLSLSQETKNYGSVEIDGTNSDRTGVFMGTGIGGAHSFLHNHCHSVLSRGKAELTELMENETLTESGLSQLTNLLGHMSLPPRVNPFVVSMLMPNAVSATLGTYFSLSGPNKTYCMACAAGTIALGNAFQAIRSGKVDTALAGGCEYLDDFHGYIFRGFDVAGVLIKNCHDPYSANRPFDEARSGFLFSQGAAGVLIMEELQTAQARNAPIIAEIIGYGESFDAYSAMKMKPGGSQIERMILSAIDDSQIRSQDVGYVNAHGTGTKDNDEIESQVLGRVFGKSVLVNSTKSLIGHTIGASGALEAIVTALSLRHQVTHTNKNLRNPIAELAFVNGTSECRVNIGLSESFAFGGHNAAVVLRRFID